ncbi:MAG: DNA mismatch repair endonuclease MutL [Patescibacteria group bacterium]
MPIKILSQDLINKIAAGEVVERPASVVKELVENSIDSGAFHITVEIENGGLNFIKVIDDGCGMNEEDARLSLAEHATSKIGNIEDLYNVQTFGFRGEALSSISAVSKFQLITKRAEELTASKICFENNEFSLQKVDAKDGTTVEVRDLFYNIPVRKKYLKTAVTELSHIIELFFSYALIYPQIAWKLIHNGRTVYQFPVADWPIRLADVFGNEVGEQLIKIEQKLNGISVCGFIGKPQIGRNNKKLQYVFVNNRPVNEFIVAKQVKSAYSTLLAKDVFPVFVLNLNIDSADVDVNVHPRKLEVRFSEPSLIYKTVYTVVAKNLDEHDLQTSIKSVDLKSFTAVGKVLDEKKEFFKNRFDFDSGSNKKNESAPLDFTKIKNDFTSFPKNLSIDDWQKESLILVDNNDNNESELSEEIFIPEYKILGQVQNSYIIVENENGLRIYDQHASSERVQYEKIKKHWQNGTVSGQRLLLPENLQLSLPEFVIVSKNLSMFASLGFEMEIFGVNSLAISAIPQFFCKTDYRQIIKDIAGAITADFVFENELSEPVEKILKMMACKSAIKFGDQLSESGMEALINDLEKLGNKYTCVHGRPCLLEFTFEELLKLFKRTQ